MPAKGSGWSTRIGNLSICRGCGKACTCPPLSTCQYPQHTAYADKNRARPLVYYRNNKAVCHLRNRIRADSVRREVLLHYGGKGMCCGFTDMEKKVRNMRFFQIDKIYVGEKRLTKF